jgi:hypothetical protein
MNLPLHLGWLGAVEAGLIALLVGFIVYLLFHWLAARQRWTPGHALGWASLVSVAIAAGIDLWNLFYLGVVKLESPVYARIALASIHDADSLANRVVFEILGAVTGVAAAWVVLERRREGVGQG